MKRTFPLIALILFMTAIEFGFQTNAVGKPPAPGKPPADVPVTSTIDGLGVDTLPTLRIQSDQAGVYTNSNSVQSIIQGSAGDWVLDLLNFSSSPQRKVLIDFRDAIAGSGPSGGAPTPPFSYQMVRARFVSKCSDYGIDMRTINGGATVYCPLAIAFDDASGIHYRLTMHANNFPEVNLVQITCLTNTNSNCTQWKIEPSVTQLDGERKNAAKLLKLATNPHQTDQNMGDFYLSFGINLTRP
jgi:hypothetical protein